VPIALGTHRLEDLESLGAGISSCRSGGRRRNPDCRDTDLNHYEDETTTQKKDALAISQLEAMNAAKLFRSLPKRIHLDVWFGGRSSLLVALKKMQATRAEGVQHATSAAVSGDHDAWLVMPDDI